MDHFPEDETIPDTEPDDSDDDAFVICFFSGKKIRRSEAVRVRLSGSEKVWVTPGFFRAG